MDNPTFLARYPEFDTTTVTDPNVIQYSPSTITYWLDLASRLVNSNRWGEMTDLGQGLFAAHNLALEALAQRGKGRAGVVPGIANLGIIASKGAGDVSVSYDTASSLEPGAGHWNLTLYGKRYIHLACMFGAGPVQVGIGGVSPSGFTYGTGWPGPFSGGWFSE